MTEVFKTTVTNYQVARILVHRLNQSFPFYKINFDLQDCDRILRVSSTLVTVDSMAVIRMICESGFKAEVLQDQASKPVNFRIGSLFSSSKSTSVSE